MMEMEPEIVFQPFPRPDRDTSVATWRVRFDLESDLSRRFGLELNGDAILGRGEGEDLYDLSQYDAANLGVSRHHLTLRPTPTALYMIDNASTNGTWRNGQSIGQHTPFALVNGDTISLGRLQFVVRIIERPSTGQTGALKKKADLADALTQVAQAITAQLEPDEVLKQVADVSMSLTDAGETSVWLKDDTTGDLLLEAHRGLDEEFTLHMTLPTSSDSLTGKVLASGEPLRASREPGGAKLKVKTGYLAESVLFVPITLGGVTFGVLAASHQDEGRAFNERDERLLTAIADFAAIAIQNARMYRATDVALARRVEELAALNQLSNALSSTLDLGTVHDLLVEKIQSWWPVEQTLLWLPSDDLGSMRPFKESAELNAFLDSTGHQIEQVIGRAASGSTPVVTDFLKLDEAPEPTEDKADGQATQKIKTRSVAAVPLRLKGRVIGMLTLIARHESLDENDLTKLQLFASPIATAIENSRLFSSTEQALVKAEQARAVIHATANTLPQPLIILDQAGKLLVSNEAANKLLEKNLGAVLMGASDGAGRTTEVEIDDDTYIATVQTTEDVGTIIVMQDITYVKQLEDDRSEFIRAVTHDLKGPLTSIKGWLHLVDKTSNLTEQSAKFMERIVVAADRMLEMINHLLEMVQLSDSIALNETTFHLEETVERAMNDLSGMAESKSMELKFEQVGDPKPVRADETRLYHVALNLVENALKYAPPKTTVIVRVAFEDNVVRLSVLDEGPGIPREEIPRIFEKYYRGKESSIAAKGMGLGLSVVQAMAHSHGGEVTAFNRREGGMCFTLELPSIRLVSEEDLKKEQKQESEKEKSA